MLRRQHRVCSDERVSTESLIKAGANDSFREAGEDVHAVDKSRCLCHKQIRRSFSQFLILPTVLNNRHHSRRQKKMCLNPNLRGIDFFFSKQNAGNKGEAFVNERV